MYNYIDNIKKRRKVVNGLECTFINNFLFAFFFQNRTRNNIGTILPLNKRQKSTHTYRYYVRISIN